MSDSPKNNDNSAVAVSPALAETQDTSQKSGNNVYFSALKAFSTASLVLTKFIDGDNPAAVEKGKESPPAEQKTASSPGTLERSGTGGLRKPSTFAQQLEMGLRNAEMPSVEQKPGPVEKPAVAVQPAQEKPQGAPAQPAQTAPSGDQQLSFTRNILSKPVERPIDQNKTSLEQEKKQLAADRKDILPKRIEVNSAADMQKAEALAKKFGVPLVANFGFPECPQCRKMEKETFPKFAKGDNSVVIAHVNIHKAIGRNGEKDGGEAIFNKLHLTDKGKYPQTYVSAPNSSTGKLEQQKMPSHTGFISYANLNKSIPKPLPLETVIRLRKGI